MFGIDIRCQVNLSEKGGDCLCVVKQVLIMLLSMGTVVPVDAADRLALVRHSGARRSVFRWLSIR